MKSWQSGDRVLLPCRVLAGTGPGGEVLVAYERPACVAEALHDCDLQRAIRLNNHIWALSNDLRSS